MQSAAKNALSVSRASSHDATALPFSRCQPRNVYNSSRRSPAAAIEEPSSEDPRSPLPPTFTPRARPPPLAPRAYNMAANRSVSNPVLTTGSVSSEVSLLFRTKRVSEIRAIEAKIRAEAEEKSDSLRELLGTRYKDLLQAADEMAVARDACSASVRDALRAMSSSASDLREHFLRKGSRDVAASAVVTDDLERRKNVHIIGGKLKHIVDSPEVLYAHLESGEVYEAAVRYSLAERNYAELKDTTGLEGVANRFAEQRWRQVHVFREQVLAAGEKKLVTPDLAPSAYSRVLAALVILAGERRDILTVVNGMLASRTGWIDDDNRNASGSVSVRLRRVAEVVKNVIVCMNAMFWNNEPDGAEQLLQDVDTLAAEDLRKLRDSGALRLACLKWINDVQTWLEEHGRNILVEADSSRVLADTLRAVDEVFADETWPAVCQSALDHQPKFVFEIFTPFISERAARVASESVQRTVDSVISDFDEAWEDVSDGPHVGKLIWSKISGHAVSWKKDNEVDKSGGGKSPDFAANEEAEVAHALAYNGSVDDIICGFEKALHEALSDVTILTQRVPSVANAFDDSVRTSLPRVLARLQGKLESIPDTFSEDIASKVSSCEALMEKALVVARMATAFGSAETVKSVYLFSESLSKDTTGTSGTSAVGEASLWKNTGLSQFRKAADDLRCSAYKTWANRFCLELRSQLQAELTVEETLCVPTGWIPDASEPVKTDTADSSSLHFPTTASTAVVNFMLRACKCTNRAGGFALPDEALHFLRLEMAMAAVQAYSYSMNWYSARARDSDGGSAGTRTLDTRSSDVAVLQMLFDVQVLQELLNDGTAADRAPSSKDTLRVIEQQLSAAIDPIDLASCRKPMREAVVGYSSRTGILFGSITRGGRRSSNFTKRPTTMTSQQASSNLVSLSKTVPRFAYLPAPMPSTYAAAAGGTVGLSAKAAMGALRSETTATSSAFRKREADTSVAGYASKVSESVGRFGRGFFESLTRKVG